MFQKNSKRQIVLAVVLTICILLPVLGISGVASSSSGGGIYPRQAAATETAQALETQLAAEVQLIFLQKTATAEALTATARPPATATATPTATSTRAASTPTLRAPSPLAEVLVEGLNIRSGPGTNFAVVARGTFGQQLPVTGQSGNCAWLQVLLEDGSDGWISGAAAYSSLNVACSVVPGARAAAAIPTPSATPRPVQQAAPPQPAAAQPPAAQQPAAQQPATGGDAAGGVVTSFEPLGTWRRGDQPYGTITQSTAQVHTGAASAAINYDFPASAGSENYVVFLAQPELRIPSGAQALTMQVYGDGSGHFLNVWVRDAGNQVWQLTFGRINHTGWAPMTAALVASRDWPNGPISGATSDRLTQPLVLRALVLDGAPDGVASSGVVYLDSLSTGAAAPASTATGGAAGSSSSADAASAPVAAAPAPTGPLTGKIAFTRFNGTKMDTLIYEIASASILHQFANWRQPDLSGGYLLVNGDTGDKDTILRASSNGDNQRPVTMNVEDAFPQFSPSLESMVYASTKNGDRKSRIYWQADASVQQDATAMKVSGKDLVGDYPVYLDNWRIAYQGCDSWAAGSRCGIYAADSRGTVPLRVTENTSDIPTGNLGSRILFTSNRSGNWDIWIINFDGGGIQQLTDDPAIDGMAVGSPDGQSIAFVSNRGGVWSVWVMNTDGGNPRKLFDIGGSYGSGDYDWIRERISWDR